MARHPLRILDIGTGSGCLAIIAADVFPDATVDAVDISSDALEVANANVVDYGFETRIRLRRSDLFERLGRRRFDLIIANPPYVTDAAMAVLPSEYRFEPQAALAGGADGMDVIRHIVAAAPRHLSSSPHGGLLLIEVGHGSAHFESAFPSLRHTWLSTSGGDQSVVLIESRDLGVS